MSNSFYSLDKLIEFGMSMAVANQMVSSMNQSLNQMQVPGGMPNSQQPSANIYFVVIEGQQRGPYSLTELSRLIAEKKVLKETYIWKPGMPQWDLAENVSEVLQLVAITPPPLPISDK